MPGWRGQRGLGTCRPFCIFRLRDPFFTHFYSQRRCSGGVGPYVQRSVMYCNSLFAVFNKHCFTVAQALKMLLIWAIFPSIDF